jgi:ubiquinone biosynthesis UbiH/UbiF/VisC/COQ6 family hydroxylase
MEFDAIIVGAGLTGSALAVALRSTDLKLALVDGRAFSTACPDPRAYAISPANKRFFSRIGIWRHLKHHHACPIHRMCIMGDAGGELEFSADDEGIEALAWMVEAGALHEELSATLDRQHNVSLYRPAVPTSMSVSRTHAELVLDDGSRLRGRLVIGADGANSWVRKECGIASQDIPYGEIGIVGTFRAERPHRHTAYQWFLGSGVLAWLPLSGDRISIVWAIPEDQGRELMAMDSAQIAARVAAAGEHALGEFALEGAISSFPLRMLRVDRMTASRVALLGDAGHVLHPLSGHGVNLGFRDADELARLLALLGAGHDPGDPAVLRAFARARAEETFALQTGTHLMRTLFAARAPALAPIRNLGMNLTGRLPVLKSMLVRYATSGRLFHGESND